MSPAEQIRAAVARLSQASAACREPQLRMNLLGITKAINNALAAAEVSAVEAQMRRRAFRSSEPTADKTLCNPTDILNNGTAGS